MNEIEYRWDIDLDDLELVETDDILDAYENGLIGARDAMRLLFLDSAEELQAVMRFNGRVMPWTRPMALSPETQRVLDEALGLRE